jgi:hypothetical protein
VLWIDATLTRDVGPVYTYVLGDNALEPGIAYRRVRIWSPPADPCYLCLLTPESDCDCPPPETQIEEGVGKAVVKRQKRLVVIDADGRGVLYF